MPPLVEVPNESSPLDQHMIDSLFWETPLSRRLSLYVDLTYFTYGTSRNQDNQTKRSAQHELNVIAQIHAVNRIAINTHEIDNQMRQEFV
jgi:hypothetical protein